MCDRDRQRGDRKTGRVRVSLSHSMQLLGTAVFLLDPARAPAVVFSAYAATTLVSSVAVPRRRADRASHGPEPTKLPVLLGPRKLGKSGPNKTAAAGKFGRNLQPPHNPAAHARTHACKHARMRAPHGQGLAVGPGRGTGQRETAR